ncbi:MAG TPA: signal peptidase I [Anaerolineaceae bacterium]|nr:signal peptidase I [Anaerolineaceae bacterium]
MQKMKAAAKNFILGIIVLILLLDLFLILGQAFSRGKLQKVLGFTQMVIISGSMEPAIRTGDLVVIREARSYKIGDVITYRSGSSLITHRIVSLKGDGFITQGDANNTPDQPIASSQVEGKLALRIPWLGRVSLFLKTPSGLLLTGLLGALLLLLNIFTDIKKDRVAIKAGESR